MQNLVPIGRFADLTGLTIKALRLYDQRGVLRPAVVVKRSMASFFRRSSTSASTEPIRFDTC